jgi:hypothetical protein
MKIKNISIFLSVAALAFSSLACWRTNRPELVITPADLPEAQMGVPYDVEILVSQNETPVYLMSISEGTLPRGMVFEFDEDAHEDKARISGVPEESGTFTFKVFVGCLGTSVNGQTGEREFTLIVK